MGVTQCADQSFYKYWPTMCRPYCSSLDVAKSHRSVAPHIRTAVLQRFGQLIQRWCVKVKAADRSQRLSGVAANTSVCIATEGIR